MATALAYGIYYTLAAASEASLGNDLIGFGWPYTLAAVAAFVAGLATGLIASAAVAALPRVAARLEREPASDPAGNQVSPMDQIMSYTIWSTLAWGVVPVLKSARRHGFAVRHQLPPHALLPGWFDWVVVVAVAVTAALVAAAVARRGEGRFPE